MRLTSNNNNNNNTEEGIKKQQQQHIIAYNTIKRKEKAKVRQCIVCASPESRWAPVWTLR